MKTLTKITAVLGLTMASHAALAVNSGGVVWNENSPNDFDADTNFTQWFVSAADSGVVDSANAINPATVVVGDVLQGSGEFTAMNLKGTNASSPTGGDPASFCPGCELTYVFNGITVTGDSTLGGGTIDIYVDKLPGGTNYINEASPASEAADGTLWLQLVVDSISFEGIGDQGFLAGFVSVLLSVVDGVGLAYSYFDTNGQEGGSDFAYTASSFFLPLGSLTANGTADLKGTSIPVPGTVLLLGLGMIGLSFARKRVKG